MLDTVVCLEILRGNPRVLQWRRHTNARVLTTWITACELECGAATSAQPDQARALVAELLETLESVGLDRAAARQFGRHKDALRRTGATLADADRPGSQAELGNATPKLCFASSGSGASGPGSQAELGNQCRLLGLVGIRR